MPRIYASVGIIKENSRVTMVRMTLFKCASSKKIQVIYVTKCNESKLGMFTHFTPL